MSARGSRNVLKQTMSTSKVISYHQNTAHPYTRKRQGNTAKIVASTLAVCVMMSIQYSYHLFVDETLLDNFFEPQQASKVVSPHLRTSLQVDDATSRQLDIVIPLSGRQDSLVRLAKSLGNSISTDLVAPNTIEESPWKPSVIRLLVTRYGSGDDASEEFRTKIANAAMLPLESVVFVNMPPDVPFSRSRALNSLFDKACEGIQQKLRCVVARMDVDMDIGSGVIRDYMKAVNSTDTAYFPIVFSRFDPASIEMVRRFLRQNITEERELGFWIDYGYGMFAIPGNALGVLRFNNSITGWGGEDDNFYRNAQSLGMKIVRKRGIGLSHVWHKKHCVDGFVEEDRKANCLSVKRENSGSHFARILRAIGEEDCGFGVLTDLMKDQSIDSRTLYESMNTIGKFVEWSRKLESENPRVFQKICGCYQSGYKGDQIITWGIGSMFNAKSRAVVAHGSTSDVKPSENKRHRKKRRKESIQVE